MRENHLNGKGFSAGKIITRTDKKLQTLISESAK